MVGICGRSELTLVSRHYALANRSYDVAVTSYRRRACGRLASATDHRHPIIARIQEAHIVHIAAVFGVDMRTYQVVVIDWIEIVVECVELCRAFTGRAGKTVVNSVCPKKPRILRANVSLAHQRFVSNIRIWSGFNRVVAAVTIHTLERCFGMRRRYAYVAVDARASQQSVCSNRRRRLIVIGLKARRECMKRRHRRAIGFGFMRIGYDGFRSVTRSASCAAGKNKYKAKTNQEK